MFRRAVMILLLACTLAPVAAAMACAYQMKKRSKAASAEQVSSEVVTLPAAPSMVNEMIADASRISSEPKPEQWAMVKAKDAAAVVPKPSSRKLVYTGTLALLVPNLPSARERIDAIILREQGYVVRASLTQITLRIAPDRFKPVIEEISALGDVTTRNVNVEDVTDQYFDLELRQQVAEQSRRRLMTLLDKSTDTKAVLEIERDIRRLTEELEQMKGALRLLASQIEMATLTVTLSEKAPTARPATIYQPSSQFYWLRELGFAHAMGETGGSTDGAGWKERLALKLGHGPYALGGGDDPRWLPPGYALLQYAYGRLLGSTARGDKLRVFTVQVTDSVGLDFWAEAVRAELVDQRGYVKRTDEAATFVQNNLKGWHFGFESVNGATPVLYDLWLVQDGDTDEVLIIDSARELATPERRTADAPRLAELTAAVNKLRVE